MVSVVLTGMYTEWADQGLPPKKKFLQPMETRQSTARVNKRRQYCEQSHISLSSFLRLAYATTSSFQQVHFDGMLHHTHESYSGSTFNTLGVEGTGVTTVMLESIDLLPDEWISLIEVSAVTSTPCVLSTGACRCPARPQPKKGAEEVHACR